MEVTPKVLSLSEIQFERNVDIWRVEECWGNWDPHIDVHVESPGIKHLLNTNIFTDYRYPKYGLLNVLLPVNIELWHTLNLCQLHGWPSDNESLWPVKNAV